MYLITFDKCIFFLICSRHQCLSRWTACLTYERWSINIQIAHDSHEGVLKILAVSDSLSPLFPSKFVSKVPRETGVPWRKVVTETGNWGMVLRRGCSKSWSRAVRIRKRTHCLIVLGTCNTLQYFGSHKTLPWQLDWLRMSTTTQIFLKSTVMNLGIRGSLREMMVVGLKICCYCWWWSFCWWLWLG